MHFLRVNVTVYDAVKIIHDVITTRNPFPYTALLMFVGVRHNKTQQIRRSVVLYQKYLTRLGEMIIFSPRFENYQFSQPRYIFLIYGNTICVFSIYRLTSISMADKHGKKHIHLAERCQIKF